MSFPAILMTLVFVTGFLTLLDRLILAKSRAAGKKVPLLIEYAKSFFPVILFVFVVRSFIAEPFRIPSASMVPTLRIGDFILVNKYDYGIRLPVFNTKLLAGDDPKRGDVVVFRYPPNPSVDYIKRIVALPGDHILYRDKQLYVNGDAVAQSQQLITADLFGVIASNSQLMTESQDDRNYQIVIGHHPQRVNVDYTIPEGTYFVMGDNRDNSSDSRFWGTVPDDHLVGRAFYVWMSIDCQRHWSCIVWDRVGQTIQ